MLTADAYINRLLDLLPTGTPHREQIALELRGHIDERTRAGQAEADVLRQLGDPAVLAESYLSAVPLVPATFGRRAAAKLIDLATLAAILVPTAGLLWRMVPRDYAGFAVVAAGILGTWAFAVYVIVAEARAGRTLGKRAMR